MRDLCSQLIRQRLIIEAKGGACVASESALRGFAIELARVLGMTPVADKGPLVWKSTEGKHAGITFMMPWVESGLMIHTWSEFNFLTVDIYSCKEFNPEDAAKVVKKWFNPQDIAYSNGLPYP